MNFQRISTYIKISRRMSVLGDAGSDNGCYWSYLRVWRDMSILCNYYWSITEETPEQIDISMINSWNKGSDMECDHILE